MEKVNDLKSWSFEKINKIYKPLTRLAKKFKKKQITIRNYKGTSIQIPEIFKMYQKNIMDNPMTTNLMPG